MLEMWKIKHWNVSVKITQLEDENHNKMMVEKWKMWKIKHMHGIEKLETWKLKNLCVWNMRS